MQKQTTEKTTKIFNKDLKYKIGAVAIAIATNLVLFNHQHDTKVQTQKISRKELKQLFDHEKETLHMPHNYGARGRYTVILGNE